MNSLIVIMVLSLALAGSISNSFAEVGDFILSFDGSDGGTAFSFPLGVAVDSNDRIIVGDLTLGLVQIFDSTGAVIDSFDGSEGGGTAFYLPSGVAVDSNDRIIVSDFGLDIVQIFDSTGIFISSFDGTGGTAFDSPFGIAVDGNDRIIVADDDLRIVQIFDSEGAFIFDFDGSDGGTIFTDPIAVAVDSNDRIIVGDGDAQTVQIFDSTGAFISTFDGTGTSGGGTDFNEIRGLAVDSEDRIIVSDIILDIVQIYDSDGIFIGSIDGSEGGGTAFDLPYGVVVDNADNIIVSDAGLIIVQIFAQEIVEDDGGDTTIIPPRSGNGGCGDCTPPTLGLNDDNKRIVDNGFSYNGKSIQVDRWHTPYPLITAQVGEMNTVEIIIYENGGINNMKLVQFGLGATEIGEPLSELEVLIEVWLETFGTVGDIGIKEIVIADKDNLIENSTVVAAAEVVKCTADAQNKVCVKVTLQYSYREATINNVMLVNVSDKPRNAQTFYFNHGIQVFGESLNPSPTYIINNKQSSQQTENLTLTLTRTDKVNHIWMDGNGIEYLQVSETRFDRITPNVSMMLNGFKINQDPMQNGQSRLNSNFEIMVIYESIRAVQHFDSSLIQGTLDIVTDQPMIIHVTPRLEVLGDKFDVEQVKAQEIMYDILNPMMKYR